MKKKITRKESQNIAKQSPGAPNFSLRRGNRGQFDEVWLSPIPSANGDLELGSSDPGPLLGFLAFYLRRVLAKAISNREAFGNVIILAAEEIKTPCLLQMQMAQTKAANRI